MDEEERYSVDKEMPWTVVKVSPKPKRMRKRFRVPSRSQQVENLKKAFRWQFKQHPKGTLSGYGESRCRYFKKQHANLLYALNPYARKLWADNLVEAFTDCGADNLSWKPVTVFSEDWDFEDFEANEPDKTLYAFLKSQGRILRNRFRGCHFIFFAELGIHRLPGRNHYRQCRHWHGVVLGEQAKLDAIAEGFGPGYAGAPGCKIKPLNERIKGLKGWLRYITKDARAQYITFKDSKGKVIHKAEPMATANQSATIDFYGDYAKPELAVASGLGAKS